MKRRQFFGLLPAAAVAASAVATSKATPEPTVKLSDVKFHDRYPLIMAWYGDYLVSGRCGYGAQSVDEVKAMLLKRINEYVSAGKTPAHP